MNKLDIINKAVEIALAEANAQPEPVDLHAADRIKYAKQVAEGTTGFYLWEYEHSHSEGWQSVSDKPLFMDDNKYRCTDISCYVSKDGEPAIRMLRTETQALQRELGDAVNWINPSGLAISGAIFRFDYKGTYTYHTKPAKLVKWADMPIGVMTNKGELRAAVRGDSYTRADVECICGNLRSKVITQYGFNELELAPASDQPWIAVPRNMSVPDGLAYEIAHTNEPTVKLLLITGTHKGYKMEGAV